MAKESWYQKNKEKALAASKAWRDKKKAEKQANKAVVVANKPKAVPVLKTATAGGETRYVGDHVILVGKNEKPPVDYKKEMTTASGDKWFYVMDDTKWKWVGPFAG